MNALRYIAITFEPKKKHLKRITSCILEILCNNSLGKCEFTEVNIVSDIITPTKLE